MINLKNILKKSAIVAGALAMAVMPVGFVLAEDFDSDPQNFSHQQGQSGQANHFLSGTVSDPGTGTGIVINSITGIKTTGIANGNFSEGWRYVINITAPSNEKNLFMRFDNWIRQSTSNVIMPAANNIRFYSPQSSNANSQANAIYIQSANAFAGPAFLTGNMGGSPSGTRRVDIVVETRIPINTQPGTYTVNFGIRTQ